jgi:hypothetical protein
MCLLGGPRALPVRRTLARADERAESPGETRLREAVRMLGFAATPQVAMRDGSRTIWREFDDLVVLRRRIELARLLRAA